MKKIIITLLIAFSFANSGAQVLQFADYFPLAVGNIFVYVYEEFMPPSITTYRYRISKDSVAFGHRYYKMMRSNNYQTEYLVAWYRYDSTNGNLLVFSPGSGCNGYNNDKIIDSLASKKNDHCDGCMYNAISLRTCADTINRSYFSTSVKTKSYHHDGLVFENLIYAKGFGKVYSSGGEPSVNYSITMKGCKVNGVVFGDTLLTQIHRTSEKVPVKFELSQNYPNPFNPTSVIRFQIADLRYVILKVYDIQGKEIVTLVNDKLKPGEYETNFDANELPSGVYFYKLSAGDYSTTKKMILIK